MRVGCKGVTEQLHVLMWVTSNPDEILIKPILEVIFHKFVVLNLFNFHCDLTINLMVIPRYNIWHSFGLPCVVFLIGTQTKILSTGRLVEESR